ncbi:MAG: hypothetical protein KDD82_11370 [Planctomycetes bacterium]|nr:hypothetical protein [Planctomycetota bacterium]
MQQELEAEGLRGYVYGSLHFRGAAHPDLHHRAQRALSWYRDLVVRAGGKGLLFSWVYDVGYLLLQADRFPFRSLAELDRWPPGERELRLDYENRFLNTLLRDPGVRAASEAVRRTPGRDDLIARACELILRPLLKAGGHPDAPALDPVLLRELNPRDRLDPAQEAQAYDELTGRPGALLEAHQASLRGYFAHLGPTLLLPEDVTELRHFSAFKRRAQRLAARRIGARTGALPAIEPRRFVVVEDRTAETELPDSGYYPSGGYSELANRGALENLVPTELVYMGEDPFGDSDDPRIDMFTLRHLENETLFFQRDSGQLMRTRRVVHLAVCPEDGLRLQLRWHKDPLVVLVYALALRLVGDLAEVFSKDAVSVEVHLIARTVAARERAQEDLALLQVLLRHEIALGLAAVHLHEALDLRALAERGRRVYGVAVASEGHRPAGLPEGDPPALAEGLRPPRVLVWRLGAAPADAEPEPGVRTPLEQPGTALLEQARDALLAQIAGAGRPL